MSEIQVRDATPEDAGDIRRILEGIIAHGGLTALTPERIGPDVTDNIAAYVENGAFVVAEAGGVIGFQYLIPGTGITAHVADIATFADISRRQSGIGRALFAATSARARTKGFRKIVAMIRSDNSNGLPYYKNLGFERVGILKEHVLTEGRYIDEVLTELMLE